MKWFYFLFTAELDKQYLKVYTLNMSETNVYSLKGGSSMPNDTVNKIISLIEQRYPTVLEANGLTDSSNPQYLWVKGIYDDMIEIIKTSNV
jgi:hypothetical protein